MLLKNITFISCIYLLFNFVPLQAIGVHIFSFSFSQLANEELLRQAEDSLKKCNYRHVLDIVARIQKSKPKTEEKAHATLLEALSYYYNEDNNKALESFQFFIAAYNNINNKTLILRAYDKYSLTYFWLAQYDKALQIINKGLQLSITAKMPYYESALYENRGRVYRATDRLKFAIKDYLKSADIKDKNGFTDNLDNTYNQIGVIYFSLSDFNNAIKYYNQSLIIATQSNNTLNKAHCYNNIGNVYLKWGNYEKAIDNIQKAMFIFDQLKLPKYYSDCLNNIGLCYSNLIEENLPFENIKNLEKALEYQKQALSKRTELKDSIGIGSSYLNLGNVYASLVVQHYIVRFGKNNKINYYMKIPSDSIILKNSNALASYQKALYLKQKENDLYNVSGILVNIGKIYVQAGLFQKASDYYKKALDYSIQASNNYLLAVNYREIGMLHFEKHEFSVAKEFLLKSNGIAKANNYPTLLRNNYRDLSDVLDTLGFTKSAYEMYKLYEEVKDIQVNEEKYKQLAFVVTKYETDKKENEIKLLKIDQEAQNVKVTFMKRSIYLTSLAVIIFLILSGFLFKLFRDKQKANLILENYNITITRQNSELEKQNDLISHQKEEITSSIKYASRIQAAIIPDANLMSKMFGDYFVLFQPKDIVSGDFYFATKHNNKIIVAAADCTGHGVPGAFMSMMGISALKELIKQNKFYSAADLLNGLRDYIINAFQESDDKRKDGMDIGLAIIDSEQNTLEFAGAYNGAIIISNDTIIEIDADRMPVGTFESNRSFSNQTVTFLPSDTIYLFSDGYADQFGGPKEKKFMYKNFKNLLLELSKKPLSEQKELLWQKHLDWKGDIEQIDDILVIGIKLNKLASFIQT